MDPLELKRVRVFWTAINRVDAMGQFTIANPSITLSDVGDVIGNASSAADGTPGAPIFRKMMTFGNNGVWPFTGRGSDTSILRRICYDECYADLKNFIRATNSGTAYYMICGTSGIGKSMLILDMIIRFVEDYFAENLAIVPKDVNRPAFCVNLPYGDTVLRFHYDANDFPIVTPSTRSVAVAAGLPHYFISDIIPIEESISRVAQIQFTDNNENYRKAVRFWENQIHQQTYTLPPFSLDEFLCCCGGKRIPVNPLNALPTDPHTWEHGELCQYLYDIFGGNIHYLKHYQSYHDYNTDFCDEISEVLTSFFEGTVTTNNTPVLTAYPDLLLHCPRWLSWEWGLVNSLTIEGLIRALFKHYIPEGNGGIREQFASVFMSYAAGKLYSKYESSRSTAQNKSKKQRTARPEAEAAPARPRRQSQK